MHVCAQFFEQFVARIETSEIDNLGLNFEIARKPRFRIKRALNCGNSGKNASAGFSAILGPGDLVTQVGEELLRVLITRDKLETLLAAILGDEACDVVSNDELMVDLKTGNKTVLHYGPYEPEFYRALLVEGNRLSPAATMVRHEFLRRHQLQFPESRDYITVEDYGLWLDLARSGARFKFIHDVQGEYVLHADNNSAQLGRHWQNTENLLRAHVFDVQRFHPSPEALWKVVSARIQMWRVRQLVRDRQWGRAFTQALRGFAKSPKGAATYFWQGMRRNYRRATKIA